MISAVKHTCYLQQISNLTCHIMMINHKKRIGQYFANVDIATALCVISLLVLELTGSSAASTNVNKELF